MVSNDRKFEKGFLTRVKVPDEKAVANKEGVEQEMRDFFSALLQPKVTQESLINDVSQNILNFFNHKDDIASGLSLAALTDSRTPFYISAFDSVSDQIDEMVEYLENEREACLWDYQEVLQSC